MRKSNPKLFFLLLLLLGNCASNNELWAQKNKKTIKEESKITEGPKKGPSVEGITEYTLDNGLKVLLFPDNSQQNITVNITYMVGSRMEGYGESGMAHLLEHMVFKGTPNHPNIPKELSEHGCRPNGTTWMDRTNYFETFTATDENLDWALDLEADRMVNSYVKKEDLETEFTVVRNEFERGENSPSRVLQQKIVSAGYLWHNYGNSTIGSREDIERVPIKNLQAFYKKYYQPDNAILLVAGKIDPEKTLKLINDKFGKIPKPTRVLDADYSVEPPQDGEKMVELRRVGDVQMIGAMYHISAGRHPDYAPTELLVDIVTNEPSGILYKNLVETKKAASEYGYTFQLKDPGLAYFAIEVTKDKDINDAKKEFLSTLDGIANANYTQAELDRVKTKALKQMDDLFKNSESFGKVLSEFIAQGDWRLIFLYRDAIQNCKLEDIQRVAKEYFKTTNRTYGIFYPTNEIDRVRVPEAVAASEMVEGYVGREAVAQGEEFDVSFENIESRTHRGKIGEGIQYAFLPKKTRGETVSAKITLKIGNKEALTNIGVVDNLTAAMLMRGSKSLSRQEILDSLNKISSNISIYGGGGSVVANISSTRENLGNAIKIASDLLHNPVFDEKEFSLMKEERKADIESGMSDPSAISSNTFSRVMRPYPKGDVRYTPTFAEELILLNEATIDRVKEFHSNFFGTQNMDISIVGDFDEEQIKSLTQAEFGNWTAKVPYSRLVSQFFVNPTEVEVIETPDKPNAMFLAGINLPLKDTDPDYPSLLIGNYLLGGGFLNSRLAVRIRQKEGISYGVGSQLSVNSQDPSSLFVTYAIYAPENAERLEKAFFEELNLVRNEGFTEDELQKAKEGMILSSKVGRAKDNELTSKLNGYLSLDRTMEFDKNLEAKITSLTLEQVNQSFRKYIDPTKITIVRAGDFKKAASEKTAPASVGGSK